MSNRFTRLFRGDRKKGRKAAKKAPGKGPASVKDKPYRAVRIVPGRGGGCDAVRKIAGRPMLVNDAPLLPLRDCTNTDCKCRYISLSDRRQEVRRDADLGITRGMPMAGSKRGASKGRRKTDTGD